MMLEQLEAQLMSAVEKAVGEKQRVGVLFSCGLDSAILSTLANRLVETTAYCCGLGGSKDIVAAHKLVDELEFEVEVVELSEDAIESELQRLLRSVATTNPVKVAVEVPLYFASKAAKRAGVGVMLSGQGADELFGGYHRYLRRLVAEGWERVEEEMRKDVEQLHETQLCFDERACAAHGVELRFPYVDQSFKEYTLELPFEFKIKELQSSEGAEFSCVDELEGRWFIRKYVLRKLAERLGLPKSIVERRKRAAQYGSASQRALERIAKRNGYKRRAAELGRRDYVALMLEELLASS